MKNDYTELDAAILQAIRDGNAWFQKMLSLVKPKALKHVTSRVEVWRVVDRRLQALRKAAAMRGVPILLLTSRDVKRYPHLEFETHEWLRRANVPHDAVCFATEKERAITWVDPRSVAVDDEKEHLDKMLLVCGVESAEEDAAQAIANAADQLSSYAEGAQDNV